MGIIITEFYCQKVTLIVSVSTGAAALTCLRSMDGLMLNLMLSTLVEPTERG